MERNLRRMYKTNAGFGEESARVEKSRRLTLHKQKEDRNRQFFQRRNVVIEPTPPEPVVKESRREKLLKWKAQKEALLKAESTKKRPPFRVGVLQHKLCPLQDLSNLPPPKSTVKKSTIKKAADRQSEHVLKPTAASTALAALANPAKAANLDSAFKRITRSQARMAPEQAQSTGKRPPVAKKKIQESFAPKNHVFKAPINLTFPVTPDALKRNTRKTRAGRKNTTTSSNWMGISGVSLLKEVEPLPHNIGHEERDVKPSSSENKGINVFTSANAQKENTADNAAASSPENKSPVAEEDVKLTPQKRRMSVRLSTPNPRKEDAENVEVVAKVSRMSIHSPTRMHTPIPAPTEIGDTFPAQFSPFIVTARGPDRHKLRRSRVAALKAERTEEEKKADQVQNFRSLLELETNRLLAICDEWEEIHKSCGEALPSSAQDAILGAVGQTRLLTKDKFQQFKRLIDSFENGTSAEGKMTADDLTGFWEMINVTVTGLDNRFKHLSNLKENNWVEEVKVAPKTTAKPRALKPEVVQQSKSRIREAIAAARKRQQEGKLRSSKNETVKSFDGGFFKIESPKKPAPSQSDLCKNSPVTPNPKLRRSLLQQALTNSASRVKSPSISEVSTRIRASLLGRRVSMTRQEEEQTLRPVPAFTATPGKGILKTSNASVQKNKVAFVPSAAEKENFSKASSEEESNSKSLRRSLRFSVGTKFGNSPVNPAPKPSLLPVRESNGIPSTPLENGDLISWGTP